MVYGVVYLALTTAFRIKEAEAMTGRIMRRVR
jgi:hypothetical protein